MVWLGVFWVLEVSRGYAECAIGVGCGLFFGGAKTGVELLDWLALRV